MKATRIFLLAVVVLTHGVLARAQSNSVPGATDYAAFSTFVTARNIFDPNRQPHYTSAPRTHTTHTRTHVSPSAPAFTLVGTMSYEKGVFAFFDGNNSDLKKVLPVNEKIADYTVTQIAPDRVTLESADKKERLELKVGDVMRQENSKWTLSSGGELPVSTSGVVPTVSSVGGDSPAAAPSPALGQNDVLKRLMELRKKEEQ
ncbi:MAG: hypothetical protein WCK57_01225 [Verrucomicrobiae bacterium]